MTDVRAPDVTDAPASFRVVRGSTTSRVFGLVAVLVVGLLAFMPSWGDASLQRKMVELLTLLAMAEMWNLLAGFAGVVSVGQQAFVGIGGIGTLEGPIIGAVLYYFLRDYFNDYETAYIIGTGVVAMVVALWVQPGIWGHMRRRLGADLFPLRRRLVRGP